MSKRACPNEKLRKSIGGRMSKKAYPPARAGGIAISKPTTARFRDPTR
jgi:hypothetical protein